MPLPSIPGLLVEAWPPLLAAPGPGSFSALHAHHAMHFVLSTGKDLRVRTSHRGRWTAAAGVLTAPDIPHAIDACDAEKLLVFFEPESDVGALLRPALTGPLRFISGA